MPSAAKPAPLCGDRARACGLLRKLIAASDEIATQAFNPQGRPVDQILDEAEGKIFRIGEEGSKSKQGFQSMDSLVVQLLDRVQELHDKRRRGSDRRAHRLLRPRPHDRRLPAR